LSAVLTATMIGGLLAQQIRQIGMMKAIGARSSQIAGMYLLMVAGLGLVAVLIGTPLGIAAGLGFAAAVAQLLNLELYSTDVPVPVYAVLLLTGMLLPVILTVSPVRRTTRISVREILTDYGTSSAALGTRRLDSWLSKIRGIDSVLLLAFRNMFRRRARLLLSLSLLGAAGAMFMTSLNVSRGWETYIGIAADDRHYDLEIRFNQPESAAHVIDLLGSVPGVEKVEAWNYVPAAIARDSGLDIVRTYPDGGHGSFTLRAVPPESRFINTPRLGGRWLQPGDSGGVVLNQTALGLLPGAVTGSEISLMVEGRTVKLRVVGVIRQILSPAAAYVTPATFASAIGEPEQMTRAVRVAMGSRSLDTVETVTQRIESVLAAEKISVSVAVSEALLDNATAGHVYIFIAALLFIAAVMAVVGLLGLTSNMSTGVIERTREFGIEFGIMRATGARSRMILRMVISEGVFTGLMSYLIAILLSLPLTLGLGSYLGNLAFRAPLPLMVAPPGLAVWVMVLLIGSIAASAFPAQQAAKLTIRETLAHV
jgi:putative ABC transport system permease protein